MTTKDNVYSRPDLELEKEKSILKCFFFFFRKISRFFNVNCGLDGGYWISIMLP